MVNALTCLLKRKIAPEPPVPETGTDRIGVELKAEIDLVFGRSLAIRELDTGSDNATEIEINALNNPYYDAERFGLSFVASPRHADVLLVTGAVTRNMETAARMTYEAMPSPRFVVAVGDEACTGGIWAGTYGVLGGADRIFPVDLKIPGNPPAPKDILAGLLVLMRKAGRDSS